MDEFAFVTHLQIIALNAHPLGTNWRENTDVLSPGGLGDPNLLSHHIQKREI